MAFGEENFLIFTKFLWISVILHNTTLTRTFIKIKKVLFNDAFCVTYIRELLQITHQNVRTLSSYYSDLIYQCTQTGVTWKNLSLWILSYHSISPKGNVGKYVNHNPSKIRWCNVLVEGSASVYSIVGCVICDVSHLDVWLCN